MATMFKIVIRWDQALLSTSEVPNEKVLESLYRMRMRQCGQFQTILAMYEQEINEHQSKQIYQKLKTMVKSH